MYETRQTVVSAEPKDAVAIAKRSKERAAHEAVRSCVMADATRRGVQPVEAAPGPGVDVAAQVFGDNFDAVTRQPFRGRVTREGRSLGGGVVNSEQPAARKGKPKPTRMVCVDVVNRARRQPIFRVEECERAVAVT